MLISNIFITWHYFHCLININAVQHQRQNWKTSALHYKGSLTFCSTNLLFCGHMAAPFYLPYLYKVTHVVDGAGRADESRETGKKQGLLKIATVFLYLFLKSHLIKVNSLVLVLLV